MQHIILVLGWQSYCDPSVWTIPVTVSRYLAANLGRFEELSTSKLLASVLVNRHEEPQHSGSGSSGFICICGGRVCLSFSLVHNRQHTQSRPIHVTFIACVSVSKSLFTLLSGLVMLSFVIRDRLHSTVYTKFCLAIHKVNVTEGLCAVRIFLDPTVYWGMHMAQFTDLCMLPALPILT